MENMWDIKKVLEVLGKHTQEGEGLSQFAIQESDFESNLESRTTFLQIDVQDASNLRFG
jgi:hypothetical protein